MRPITLFLICIIIVCPHQTYSQELSAYGFEPIQEHYGIKYDLTPLGPDFDPSQLILTVTNINIGIETDIEGVIIINSVTPEIAKLMKTAPFLKGDLLVEDSKYVLFISPDVALHPEKILPILHSEKVKTPQDIERERIEVIRRGEIARTFDDGQGNRGVKAEMGAEVARAPSKFIESLNKFMQKKPHSEDIHIEEYYLSFSQLFANKEQTGSGDTYEVPPAAQPAP
jgi:hypothetical protein